MSARSDFLAYLTVNGYAPQRAVLYEEGTGTPAEYYTATSLTVSSGTPTWYNDPTYGNAGYCDAVGDAWALGDSTVFIGTTKQTVILIRQKDNTTAANSFCFAVFTASNTPRMEVCLPFGDGKVLWDFGGSAGANRISYTGYTQTTNIEAWAFKAGPSGMKIFKDGTEVANNGGTSVTRTADTGALNINRGFGLGGYAQKFYFIAFIADEVSDAILGNFTKDNALLSGFYSANTRTQALIF